jgi:hypothetical protein
VALQLSPNTSAEDQTNSRRSKTRRESPKGLIPIFIPSLLISKASLMPREVFRSAILVNRLVVKMKTIEALAKLNRFF